MDEWKESRLKEILTSYSYNNYLEDEIKNRAGRNAGTTRSVGSLDKKN